MNRTLALLIACLLSLSVAMGQEKQEGLKKPTLKPAAKSREGEIWRAIDDRIEAQVEVWFKDGEYIKAIQLIGFQYELYPNNYEVATNLGWMYENVEQYDDGVAIYRRYGSENPADPDRWMPLGQYFFIKRKYDETVKVLAPVVGKVKGAHPNQYRMLATSYERLKKFKESIAVWEQYIKLAPTDGQAKVNIERVKKKLSGS